MKFWKKLFTQTKYPLGRWHNSGEYFNEKFLEIKEKQKLQRIIMKKYKIDPYYWYFYKINLFKKINQ